MDRGQFLFLFYFSEVFEVFVICIYFIYQKVNILLLLLAPTGIDIGIRISEFENQVILRSDLGNSQFLLTKCLFQVVTLSL